MNNAKMGQFISELRKSRQMTQKDLAAKLNISDKAVSKWERGLSYPDILLLSPLSDILGVTTTELLNGERADSDDSDEVNVEALVVSALEYGQKNAKRKLEFSRSVIAASYSVLLLIGIFVVIIVDAAASGAFTWSAIPVLACVFAWLVFYPAIRFGVKGIAASLISISVFIAPYLYAMDNLIAWMTKTDTMIFPMGIRIAPFAIAFFWIAYFLFKKLKTRILLAIAILVLASSPISYFINSMIANMLNQPHDGVTLVVNTFAPVIVAAILFAIDFIMRKRM